MEQHFFGVDLSEGLKRRGSARGAAQRLATKRFLCRAKRRDPAPLPLVGIFIQTVATVGRRTLIIHRCPVNASTGKQTVLQIGSPEFAPLLYLAGNMGRC